jgi:outer membrane immunogenic protein
MRCFAVVGTGLLSISLFSGLASAADFPAQTYPTAAAPVVTYNWTGCHVGGHVGGVVSEDRTTSLLGSSNSFSSAGFAAGGQIGCDYQFAPGWVAGVEGRAAWSSLKNTHASHVRNLITGIELPSQFTLSNDLLASATARLGYGFADRWLVFVRGGAAWTQEKADDAFTTVGGLAVDPSATMTRTGWTAGTGVEWAFTTHWSATLEYDYYDFGSHGARLTSATNNVVVTIGSVKDTIHEAAISVDYHF